MASPSVKLKLDEIPLCGLAKEIALLREAADRVDQTKIPEVVFITGDSGVGKTSLWKQLKLISEEGSFFISGKFDACFQHSAIHDAMSDLCEQIAASGDLFQIREALFKSMGGEHSVLRTAVPRADKLIGSDIDSSMQSYNEAVTLPRLKQSFRALLRSAAVTGKSVIMCIDDLHWADLDDWDVLQDLASDPTLSKFLLIGALRKNESCSISEERLAQAALTHRVRFQSLPLSNLDVAQVNDLLVSILRMSKESTESLARVIHAKSDGNPHFAIQVLAAIEKQKLITYSLSKFCWEWDVAMIQCDVNIGDNIVDAYLCKISHLSHDTRFALIIGSCIGAKFDSNVLVLLIRIFPDLVEEEICRERLDRMLDLACSEGLTERQGESSVRRFAHDKIHQAFYSQVSVIADPLVVHLAIGRRLLSMWTTTCTEEWLCFLAASQINRSIHLVEDSFELSEIAQLNLAAAKTAMSASAFRPTAEYVGHGLQAINRSGRSSYDLRLQLLTLKAKTGFCLGNFSECLSAVNEVLLLARTIDDKIPVFYACVDAHGAQSQLVDCFKQGLSFVKELGVKLPRHFNKMTVIMALIKAKKLMKGKTEEMLLEHPVAKDASKIAAIRILNTLVTYSFQARLNDMMATLALTNTCLILKYGLTQEAGSVLVTFAFLLSWLGDFDQGYILGQTCLKLAERSKTGIPRTFMNYYGGLDHLKKPLHKSLEPLLRGYRAGFEVGDTVYGCYCCHFYLNIFYFLGLPLENLLRDMNSFSREMEAYNMRVTLDLLKVFHQSVFNLMSTDVDDPTSLNGEAMMEAEVMTCGVQQTIESMWFGKLILAIYFLNVEVIRENLDKLVQRPADLDGCMYYVPMLMWCEAYGAILVAKTTKKRRYKKIAMNRFKKMEKWVSHGNVNCCHLLLHLTAELASLDRKSPELVKPLYDSAIATARRSGFSNCAAVANEGAASYFLGRLDLSTASIYVNNAFELYDSWGAKRKCISLGREHGALLQHEPTSAELSMDSSASTRGTSFAGRQRHTSVIGRLHRGESLNLMPKNKTSSLGTWLEGSSNTLSEVDGI